MRQKKSYLLAEILCLIYGRMLNRVLAGITEPEVLIANQKLDLPMAGVEIYYYCVHPFEFFRQWSG